MDSVTNTYGILKRRHVVIAYHVTREAYAIGLVKLYHIAGEDNPADHLTKGLERLKLWTNTKRYLKTGEVTRHNKQSTPHLQTQQKRVKKKIILLRSNILAKINTTEYQFVKNTQKLNKK